MIFLDTNVVSELLKDDPDPAVADWLRGQSQDDFRISRIVEAELLFGLHAMPTGRRRERLAEKLANSSPSILPIGSWISGSRHLAPTRNW